MIGWLSVIVLLLVVGYELGPALAAAVGLVLLPPRYDPAIRLKEWLHRRDK